MIPNHWYAILDSNEVPRGRAVGVTRMGEKLVLWRDARGDVACAADLCPHRGAALSLGQVAGDCVRCPFHGFEFDPAGRCTFIPANGRSTPIPKALQVRVYPTRDAHGFIYVWWGQAQAEYPPLPWFESLDDSFTYATVRDRWTMHYTRAIENQLDVAHLPFVHYNTIGRGNRTLVNGPLAHIERRPFGDAMSVWVYNAQDTGQAPLKMAELPDPGRPPFLEFLFPNLWQLLIDENLRMQLAFVPIDEGNTQLYLRAYQRFVRLPLLRQVVARLMMPSNRYILSQDKRVVLTQRPVKTDLQMGEKLIPADGPIILYRRRRNELMGA